MSKIECTNIVELAIKYGYLDGYLMSMCRGILVDRDGVLIVNRKDYVKSVEEVELIPGVAKAIEKLLKRNYTICVVTNQAGIAKGLYTEETLKEIHSFIESLWEQETGQSFHGKIHWYFCPHRDEDRCECRKPKPGMLIQAMKEHFLQPSNTWMIGDAERDIEAGIRAGCRTVLVQTGLGKEQKGGGFLAEKVFPDFPSFVESLLWKITL